MPAHHDNPSADRDLPEIEFPHGERPLHEYLRIHADEQPDRVAINFYGGTITYNELDRLSDAFATYLAAEGYEPGDIIFMMLHNLPQFYIAYYGAHKAGMVVAPPFPEPEADRIKHHLDELETDIFVTHEGVADEVAKVEQDDEATLSRTLYVDYEEYLPDDPVPSPPDQIRTGSTDSADSTSGGRTYLMDVIRSTDPDPPSRSVSLDDLAYLMHSGGTTGVPKGVKHTFYNQLWKSASFASIYEYTEKETLLQTFPLCRTGGTVTAFPQMIYGNTAVILHDQAYDAESIMTAVDAYDVNYAMVLTSDVYAMLENPDLETDDLGSLDYTSVVSFTQDPTPELAEEWRRVAGSGLSDYTYGGVEVHGPGTWTYKLGIIESGFVGLPHHGVDITIRGFDSGELLGAGELGEIAIDDEALMEGYWKRPEKNDEVFADDGSFLTDDAGRLSEDGYLYFFGRNDELIKIGDKYVAPKEVEYKLEEHPDIDNAGVVGGKANDQTQVIAFVSPSDPSITTEELTEWASSSLATPLIPEEIRIVERLPMTSVGKLDRRALQDRLG